MSDSETFEKYFGSRGGDFRSLIESLLRRGKLNPKYYDTILGDGGLDLYSTAFTHPTIDEENNYCLLYTSPSPRDYAASRMPSSA